MIIEIKLFEMRLKLYPLSDVKLLLYSCIYYL